MHHWRLHLLNHQPSMLYASPTSTGDSCITALFLSRFFFVNNAGHMGITIVNEEKFRAEDGFFIHNDNLRNELRDIKNVTEERLDEINGWFLRDLKSGKLEENGWPLTVSAYKVSKAAINAYTRLLAEEYPNMLINCVHPGYVITDMSVQTGFITPEEGAKAPVMQESPVEVMVFLLGDKVIIFLLHSD
ncbi:hypothetical protein L2E82_20361 [Cichorium intybus]|uniref:Uncharacterized protein n=1 Tax=Cichorium intybus TaxID=13427 RepID=A0ACB9DT46_CICIN|nr:hypothetical protein L2E82_20361 [Cichorium intybus]